MINSQIRNWKYVSNHMSFHCVSNAFCILNIQKSSDGISENFPCCAVKSFYNAHSIFDKGKQGSFESSYVLKAD